ncbi:protease [Chondromyces apiculatus]|uniref:protease n=1 Tax=Chondromyces apiculatus TaxID=51 RepID=UPI0012DFD95C|nr:protease [Chondromyces apiculatus]
MTPRTVAWLIPCCVALGALGCGAPAEPPAETGAPSAPAASEPPPAPAGSEAPPATGGDTPAQGTTEGGKPVEKLQCSMTVPATARAGQPLELQFKLQNTSTEPLHVLNWNTPLESRPMNGYLEITRDGAEVPYQGPMAKRGDPSASAYVTIAPGAAAEGKLDVALVYDLKKPGRYRIAFRNKLFDVTANKADVPRKLDQFQEMTVSCAPVETTLTP